MQFNYITYIRDHLITLGKGFENVVCWGAKCDTQIINISNPFRVTNISRKCMVKLSSQKIEGIKGYNKKVKLFQYFIARFIERSLAPE